MNNPVVFTCGFPDCESVKEVAEYSYPPPGNLFIAKVTLAAVS